MICLAGLSGPVARQSRSGRSAKAWELILRYDKERIEIKRGSFQVIPAGLVTVASSTTPPPTTGLDSDSGTAVYDPQVRVFKRIVEICRCSGRLVD